MAAWGSTIDAMHADPSAPKILYKVERAGCCLPAICEATFGCEEPKKRSYLWIMEGGVETNLTFCCPGMCCIPCTEDFVIKDYFDNSFYKPACCGQIKKGIATEEDLNYCCFCINCVCCYNACAKPCYGASFVASRGSSLPALAPRHHI